MWLRGWPRWPERPPIADRYDRWITAPRKVGGSSSILADEAFRSEQRGGLARRGFGRGTLGGVSGHRHARGDNSGRVTLPEHQALLPQPWQYVIARHERRP